MTNPFVFNQGYQPRLDVRDYVPMLPPLLAPLPDGCVSVLIAPRRAGKTWTLHGLARILKREDRDAHYFDLRDDEPTGHLAPDAIALCDEPGARLKADGSGAGELLNWCLALHRRHVRVVIAMTPREYRQLRAADGECHRLSPKAEGFLPPVRDAEARALLARDARASAIFDVLPERWKCNFCLLELLGSIACEVGAPEAPGARFAEAVRACSMAGSPYLSAVFEASLTDAQREVLRRVAHCQCFDENGVDARLLLACGLLHRDARDAYHVGDPVLAAKLEPLRIHHVSDVHVGPKSADALDVGSGESLRIFGDAAGQGPVRDRYVHHLAELEANGKAPHLVVISGDLVEWATPAQYAEFMRWLDRVREVLKRAKHPGIADDDPRVLVVGGNHDVSWTEASKPGGARSRHEALATALGDVPHPHLEIAPDARGVQQVTYEALGVAFALLGSAELGGQVHEHAVAADCLDAMRDLAAGTDTLTLERIGAIRERLSSDPVRDLMALYESMPEAEREARRPAYTRLLSAAARTDPGLVHAEALQALRKSRWPQRVTVKIAVLHHPLSPLVGPELRRHAGLLNAADVKKTLLDGHFALALHGHAHTGWLAEEAWLDGGNPWTLRIASAPSLGSAEVRERHGYNVVEVWPDLDDDAGITEKRIVVRRVVHRGEVWSVEAEMGPFGPGTAMDHGLGPSVTRPGARATVGS